jgi:hypothetical protein
MSGRETEEHLGGSGALERLMGAKVGVVEERELDSAPGFRLGERGKRSEAEKAFRRFPEPFNDGDGANLAESPEAMGDGGIQNGFAKSFGGELRATVGDEILGKSVLHRCLTKEVGDLRAGRLASKNTSRQRKPGEDIADSRELEGEEPKEGREVREVGHRDVVGISSEKGAAPRRFENGLGSRGRLFLSNPANGLGGDSEAGASEGLGDALASPEAGGGHGLDQMPDDVGEAANGGLGLEERADGVPVWMDLALRFPARNGVRGDVEASGGFPLRPTEEALHTENPESVLGRVVSAVVPMDLLNVFDEDLGDLPVGVEQSLMEPCVSDGVLKGVVLVPPFGDLSAEGQSEEPMGFEHGIESRLWNSVMVREVLEGLIGELVGGGDGRYHASPPENGNGERF